MPKRPPPPAPEPGRHNADLEQSRTRLIRGATYKNAATICIIPTLGKVHARVLTSWFGLMSPMNAPFHRIITWNQEVGDAYSSAIAGILENPILSTWRYVLTLEHDNMPPPDGIVRLVESLANGPYAAVGGLYWTKGEMGQPMIYGDPKAQPRNFLPQVPQPNALQECLGLGMGFTLFRLDLFKDERLPKPWFRTIQEYVPGRGARAYTQDLQFFEQAVALGYRFACDTRVLVGHYDEQGDIVW